jgi:TolB protein
MIRWRAAGIRTRDAPRGVLLAMLCSAGALGVVGALPAAGCAQDTTRTPGVRIGLTYAAGTRPGVLLLPATGANADSVNAILARDLDFSDRFNVIPAGGEAPSGALNYPLYAQSGAAAVVQASVTPAGSLHIAVHDVAAARVLNVIDVGLPAAALSPEWRFTVHGGGDEVEKTITGERGVSQTRILYEREGSLWIVDSDGANAHQVSGTTGGMSPAWHPDGHHIAYQEFANSGHHTIVVRDLADATSRRFGTGSTLNITPTFSPDGSTLVFASGDDGTDLYGVEPFTAGRPHRVSVGGGTTTSSPTFSPDGRRIAFTSSRLGHAEVYIMDADGTNPVLLTSGGIGEQSFRSDPDWSPDGRRVAFQSMINGVFQVMTINVRDQSVQALTSEGANEQPSWAPDARHLVFTSSRSGTRQLWVLDTESFRTRQLTRGGRARLASWSPRFGVAR